MSTDGPEGMLFSPLIIWYCSMFVWAFIGPLVGGVVGYCLKSDPKDCNLQEWSKATFEKPKSWTYGIVGVIAFVLAIWSIIYGCIHELAEPFRACDPVKKNEAIILACWTIIPPIWFWIEAVFLFRIFYINPNDFEKFKHRQDQSAKVWLALGTLLLAVFFGKDLTREAASTPQCAPTTVTTPCPKLSGK